MKIKQNVYISRPDDFLRNPNYGYSIISGRHMDEDWQFVGVVEFEVNVNTDEMIESVSAEIDSGITELEGKIEVMKQRKAELLALPSPV